jgi:tRNA A37 threonylcarbamoyladenosine biosynthesis protein TsaE
MTDGLKYDWYWTKDWTGNGAQIVLCADQLDRSKYAEFLTNYLAGFTDSSYVMNLNAEWGAGKTYFLQRWYQTIKEHHPAAYVDA